MYVNGLEEVLLDDSAGVSILDFKLLLLFFADDLVIFNETPPGLHSEINKLKDYCNKWKLKINTSKSKILVFRNGNRPVCDEWYFDGQLLTTSNKIPYLGFVCCTNGSFFQTQLTLAEQESKRSIYVVQEIVKIYQSKTRF